MADDPKPFDAASLLAEIADKSGRTVDEVRGVLTRHGVAYKPSIAVPKHLCIRSLAFTGEKKGEKASGTISFAWEDLGPGLMAMLSDRNFRGKSTLLGMMRWCLTGRRAENIPGEMAEWFDAVKMAFTLDDQAYEVDISDAVTPAGTLWRVEGEKRFEQAPFGSHEGFEAVMSDFFMGQLGLQTLVVHVDQKGQGIDQTHHWPWLSGAMVIEPSPKHLFGSAQHLRIRMMQMYLGVPWADATNDVLSAKNRIATETRQVTAEIERTRGRRKARLAELDADLASLHARLAKLPREDDQRQALRRANREVAAAEARLRAGERTLAAVDEDLDAAKEAYAEARRDLQDFKDGRAARRVFRSLDPLGYPRCDEVFDEERRQETRERHVCVVCGTDEVPEGNPAAQEVGLKDAVAASEAEVKSQKLRREAAQGAVSQAKGDRERFEAECRRLEAALAQPSGAHALEMEIMLKEARKEELEDEEEPAPEPLDGTAILEIAEKVTKQAFKPLQEDLLAEVSELTRDYAVRFGVESLEGVELRGNCAMALKKGGGTAFFGTQTDGERARLKIATTIAIITVAERRGLGRHPGLLLIDSPGANEMVGQDYASLVAGLAELVEEIGHIQVFVAAVNNDTIRGHVSDDKVRYASGDDYLW
ncbi:hypothetical protein [Methylobacterium sp. J-067]|uniref:hypothetical protein n=1 Tax=Methylobacterium sp. J-067 TaxID=2836648 RepID=UPI001FB8ACA2|nr:hypothetical protein [Methylobacterium sp. J-067]MCJ2023589.1 hypothetical protein [Methylobacterium sp. J-067]